MGQNKKLWGLLQRRECTIPTWKGWLVLVLAFLVLGTAGMYESYSFLAVSKPVTGGLLVVEGWAADLGMKAVIEEFRRNTYEKVYVTGGPLLWGGPLSEYKTYAEGGAASLVKLGLDVAQVQAVPSKWVMQDRTYASAVSLRNWLQQHGVKATRIHLMSEGPHARRSRLLFQKAFGNEVEVGVTALPPADYDERHWWRYSAGIRLFLDEGIAYIYARFFFHPGKGTANGKSS